MLRKIDSLALSIISAILLTLAYPPFNLEFLAWAAFIPLFFAIEKKSKLNSFKLGFLFGLLFFGITIYWLTHVSFLGFIILVITLALFFGVFATLVTSTNILLAPFLWILLEYARTHILTGFGWALLGYSQYLRLPVIQIADKTGVWGVSFIIMLVNVAGYKLVKHGMKRALVFVLTAVLALSATLFYGYNRLKEPLPSGELVISIIQGNIPQEQKWDGRYKYQILEKYEILTREAVRESPDLIIWPETSVPGYLEEKDLFERITTLANEVKIPLLVGAPSIDEDGNMYNSAILISKNGEILKKHDKIHLVPLGEYIPFEKEFSFIRRFVDKPIGEFTAGSSYTVFRLENGSRFGVLICFEDIFPGLVRDFVERKADFMVNMTNDAWFMETAAPYQHAQASVFRAVENRVPVVRAANTGLSCFIDSKGKIVDRVRAGKKDIFVSGFKTSKIYIK